MPTPPCLGAAAEHHEARDSEQGGFSCMQGTLCGLCSGCLHACVVCARPVLTCVSVCVSVCASGCVRWVLSCSRVRDWSPRYALLCRRSSPNHPSNHITSLCVCVALHGRQLDDGTTSEHGPLWVCLTCAAVGCGQNDAGKHGLEHYDVKHHPIALAPETMQCWWVLAPCPGACTLLQIAVTWRHCLAQVLQVR